MEGLLRDVDDQPDAAPVLLLEFCSKKEDKPGGVGAVAGVQPYRPQTLLGIVTGPIYSLMLIRQGKVTSRARVLSHYCWEHQGTGLGGSLHTSREHVSHGALLRTTQGCGCIRDLNI